MLYTESLPAKQLELGFHDFALDCLVAGDVVAVLFEQRLALPHLDIEDLQGFFQLPLFPGESLMAIR
jgi:hypothetical protein